MNIMEKPGWYCYSSSALMNHAGTATIRTIFTGWNRLLSMVQPGNSSVWKNQRPFNVLVATAQTAVLCAGLLPGTPWGRVWGGSWPESVCSGSPPARAPPGGSSEDWGWAGRSPGATVRRRESTALCCTCTGEHKDQWPLGLFCCMLSIHFYYNTTVALSVNTFGPWGQYTVWDNTKNPRMR